MDVCEIYQVPHSQFLSWDPDDRDKAVMHQVRKQERCPSCGTHPDDWDPEVGGSVDAYTAKRVHCRGCQETEKANEALEKARQAKENRPRRGTSIRLERNPEA
ncbi:MULTISPECIES: hypothetical protein [Pseudonocardia]|uniref:Uncharacterized protein n=2 Tax=Pseudonocardia TaxID=1847 RepID=A0A1Y2N657_PSEAH|nr:MULTISPECIES: hypothetical protein [Pseudonocardia]OSY42950.1 hypothetical protein BG845_01192 [Pseudonocardia autotrophica]TDN77526.1 hypothetical protein C8E95_6774 [Pseudonocardia autotrophica]BBG01554.1 hypothetical protein Pdca_27630 [Pseudonocardia autotrophica]GEC29097.1 hypothetical protein PSA01_61260 [Pseudonocardia saturnea]